jgi:hypothetical protein
VRTLIDKDGFEKFFGQCAMVIFLQRLYKYFGMPPNGDGPPTKVHFKKCT